MELTHINEKGEARMVDVGAKEKTVREAVAQAVVSMQTETLQAILAGNMKKGDVLSVARVAAIMAAKRTHELIPMCHPLPLSAVEVEIIPMQPDQIKIQTVVRCTHETGVEMEALTAASIGALTIYDMCKAIDRGMEIGEVQLLKKSGGRSGLYERSACPSLAEIKLLHDKNAEENQLSILSEEAAAGMEKLDYSGLCMKRFQANLTVSGLNDLKKGDKLKIGGAEIEISQVGKKCFDNCSLVASGVSGSCPLKNGCAFARVIKTGKIKTGVKIEKLR